MGHSQLQERFGKKRVEGYHDIHVKTYSWVDDKVQEKMDLRTEIQYEGVAFSELLEAMLALHPVKLPMIVTEDHGVSARLGTTSHVEGKFDHEAMVGEEMTADFLAKELVQLRMVARAQVEKLGVNENRRVYLDTTKNGRAAVQ